MVDVHNKMCRCGLRHPHFGHPGERLVCCASCRDEGTINFASKTIQKIPKTIQKGIQPKIEKHLWKKAAETIKKKMQKKMPQTMQTNMQEHVPKKARKNIRASSEEKMVEVPKQPAGGPFS